MAADVSTLVRLLNKHLDEQRLTTTTEDQTRTEETNLITRDLFGSSSSKFTPKDIDLDLQVPHGFEKRLDLKSGKVYLQRRNSPISSTSTTTSDLQSSTSNNNNVDATLDLKLVQSYDYRSVCTLDKVKSALERAVKAESAKKRSLSRDDDDEEEERSSSSSLSSSKLLFAGGCSSCLMYVMISKSDPKCPRCNSIVPVPSLGVKKKNKKPKLDLDLNLNLLSSSW